MVKIFAKGKKFGNEIDVKCWKSFGKLKITFNGIKNDIYEQAFQKEMDAAHVICEPGYCAEPNSIQRAYNVLGEHYFDEPPEITTTGEIRWPEWKSGRIY